MLIKDFKRIGDKIQIIRKQAGLSQEEAAWRADLSLRAYADIEHGEVNPKLGSVLNICEVFHITPDMIMTEEESPASTDYDEILSEVDMLSPEDKFVAFKLLEAFYNAVVSRIK